MNRKLFGLLIPVMGFAVILGSGFATWEFQEDYQAKTVDSDTTGTGTITGTESSNVIGTLTTQNFAYKLDQGGIGNTDVTVGASITTAPKFTFTLDDNFVTALTVANTDISTVEFAYTVSKNVTAATDIEDYLVLSAGTTGTFTCTKDSGTQKWSATVELSSLALNWADGKKPVDKNSYDAMVTAKSTGELSLNIKIAVNTSL